MHTFGLKMIRFAREVKSSEKTEENDEGRKFKIQRVARCSEREDD